MWPELPEEFSKSMGSEILVGTVNPPLIYCCAKTCTNILMYSFIATFFLHFQVDHQI